MTSTPQEFEEVLLEALGELTEDQLKFFQKTAETMLKCMKEIKTEEQKRDFMAGVLHGVTIIAKQFTKFKKT